MAKKHLFLSVVSALLLYVIFLIATLPAAQALRFVEIPKGLSLGKVSGTIWNGQMTEMSWQGIPIRNISWQLSAMHLLLGKANVDIKAGNLRDSVQTSVTGELTLSADAISTPGLKAAIPANVALAIAPLPLPVNASGKFSVNINSLDWRAGQCIDLNGQGQWLNAQVGGTQGMIPLGEFSALLSCQNDNLQMQISPPNVFNLDVLATLKADGSYRLQGKFKPDSQLPQEVKDAARFFGRTDAQGFYTINWK